MLFTSGETMSTANPNAHVSLNVDEVVKDITCSVITLNCDQTDSLNKTVHLGQNNKINCFTGKSGMLFDVRT